MYSLFMGQTKNAQVARVFCCAEKYKKVSCDLISALKYGLTQYNAMIDCSSSVFSAFFVTLLLTLSGLTVSLPFYVHGRRRIQVKTLIQQYLQILPLTSIGVLPRILVLIVFFSAIKVANAWFAVIVLTPLLLAYCAAYWSILYFYVRPKMIEEEAQQNSR